MTRRLSLLARAAAIAVPLVLISSSSAQATTTLTGPNSTWTTTGSVAEPHFQASTCVAPEDALPVIDNSCPTYDITLSAPAGQTLHFLDVRLDMTPTAAGKTVEDYDIYLYDSNGAEVALSANALGTEEVLSVSLIPNGDYTIKVVPYTNLPDSTYTLTARFRTAAS